MGDLRKIGKYILLEEQEQTEVGRTWRGAELANGKIDKYLLVEFIQEQLAADDGFIDQYLSQSLVAAKLEHPNILRKVNSLHESGQLVTAFEFHEGFSLGRVLNRCQNDGFPLHIDHALLVASKLLSALTYAKSKHLTHGFIHPSMVFVTHEGEIKLKGFALSAGMRAYGSGPLPLDQSFFKYAPPGMNLNNDDRDQLDIYGCGAILFEMIAGESFQNGLSGNPGARIDQAMTASTGEAIPPKIATILHKALDPSSGQGYVDIQQMGKEMEELLYSGEYSPTTFNLAFFMHSAFRGEMEAFSERIAKEREIDFSGHTISQMENAASSVAAVAQTPPPPSVPTPRVETAGPAVQTQIPPAQKKSKLPLILGGLAAAAVIAIAAFFLLPGEKEGEDRFSKRAAELQAEGVESEKELLRQQQEELRLQNQALMAQLKEQAQESQPSTDVEGTEENPEDSGEQNQLDQAREEAQKEIEAQRAKFEKEREQLEAQIREQQQALDAAKAQKEEQPKTGQAKAEQAKNEQAEPEKTADTAITDSPPETKDEAATGTSGEAEPETDTTSSRPVDVPKESTVNADDETREVITAPRPKVRPIEGQLVALDDPDLTLPTLLVPYKTHQVPSKAIRAGVVRRDRTIPFIMRVLVNEKGAVENTELFRSPLKEGDDDYGMIDKAIRTAKKMKFSSPSKMGVKVKVWMYITVNFTSK